MRYTDIMTGSPTDSDVDTEALVAILRDLPRVAVAFSGGVDSAVVAAAAVRAVGGRALALTADSPSVPRAELTQAVRLAEQIGIAHRIVSTSEFANPRYIQNAGDRCYFCKSELYSVIRAFLTEPGWTVCSGANQDDLGDYRPGLVAAAEQGIRHPLQEIGWRKATVRQVARLWKLPVWDKPASPCLASRIVPGLEVTPERTFRIEQAEAFLRENDFDDCRVRYHENDLARVEVPLKELPRLSTPPLATRLLEVFRELGFRYVTLDLAGFQSGSMNDLIPLAVRARFTPAPPTVS
ncbi:MAG: ATP-dependent sacrificial sulfur transferase LarE [Gemmataceae bacterium]